MPPFDGVWFASLTNLKYVMSWSDRRKGCTLSAPFSFYRYAETGQGILPPASATRLSDLSLRLIFCTEGVIRLPA